MNTEAERAEFVAWQKSKGADDDALRRGYRDDYIWRDVQKQWEAWQERAAICARDRSAKHQDAQRLGPEGVEPGAACGTRPEESERQASAPQVVEPAPRRKLTAQDALAWAERHDMLSMATSDLVAAFEDAASIHLTLEASEPSVQVSYQIARDAILNERGPLEGAGLDGDQINAVLGILDDAFVGGNAPAPSVQVVPLTEDQIRRLWLEQTDNYAIAWKGALGLARAVERVIHAAQALPAAPQPVARADYRLPNGIEWLTPPPESGTPLYTHPPVHPASQPALPAAQQPAVEPVARVVVHKTGGNAGIAWSAVPVEDAPLMRDGDLLYASPTAQPAAPKQPNE